MKKFMNEDFLLTNEVSKTLYHKFSKDMPIIDYHCHINPQEIFEDKQFENISQVWLKGDHYKWRLLRSNGVEEHFITGDATDREKFQKWAETLEKAIGNPIYHWSHLELQQYFGYHGALNADTAEEVWNLCNSKLLNNLGVREIIKRSNVEVICSTDDPIDSLEWHQKIAKDTSFQVQVLPTWRPDISVNINLPSYLPYLEKLSSVSNITIASYCDLKKALRKRLDFFISVGCKITDHGLDFIMFEPSTEEELEGIFSKRLSNIILSSTEVIKYKTGLMLFMAGLYKENNLAMQLHFGCKRNNNSNSFSTLGADTGFDCINNFTPASQMADFLNHLNSNDSLPKTILYSLNPNDDAVIGTIIGCFQDDSVCGKVQHGSAWWFNDHKSGMINQMTSLANLGLLSNFLGMLTDSRSFLSYTRHEYFRRILCQLIGGWVENGEYPEDYKALETIVKNISYHNAKNYFEF